MCVGSVLLVAIQEVVYNITLETHLSCFTLSHYNHWRAPLHLTVTYWWHTLTSSLTSSLLRTLFTTGGRKHSEAAILRRSSQLRLLAQSGEWPRHLHWKTTHNKPNRLKISLKEFCLCWTCSRGLKLQRSYRTDRRRLAAVWRCRVTGQQQQQHWVSHQPLICLWTQVVRARVSTIGLLVAVCKHIETEPLLLGSTVHVSWKVNTVGVKPGPCLLLSWLLAALLAATASGC